MLSTLAHDDFRECQPSGESFLGGHGAGGFSPRLHLMQKSNSLQPNQRRSSVTCAGCGHVRDVLKQIIPCSGGNIKVFGDRGKEVHVKDRM